MALTLLACVTKEDDGANKEGAPWLLKPERKAVKRAVLEMMRSKR